MKTLNGPADDQTQIVSKSDDHTRIIPRPPQAGSAGIISAQSARSRIRPQPYTDPFLATKMCLPDLPHAETTSPVIQALWPILAIVPELRQIRPEKALGALPEAIKRIMETALRRLDETGASPQLKQDASYIVCALIDETALNSNWGELCHWAQQPLLSQFHQETYGGERFFDLLDANLVQPHRHTDMLTLHYFCLSLGFMGRLRLDPVGPTKLAQYRAQVYSVLPDAIKAPTGMPSESHKPKTAIRTSLQNFIPAWIYSATLILIAFGIFSVLSNSLNRETDELRQQLAELVPTPARALKQEGKIRQEILQLRQQLQSEIEQGAVAVENYSTHTEIVLSGDALFASGSATIAKAYHPILFKISKTLSKTPGRIVVAGHTDNQAIRTAQFPSNWHLSLARATAVVAFLEQSALFKAVLLPEGRGATTPVHNNKTPDSRAQNRRVVIEIYYGAKA